VFGELDGRSSARTEAFLAACVRAGIDAAISPDIRVALWSKWAFICAQAGVTAATRLPIGEVRESPAAWALFRQVAEEVWRLGRASGVALADDLVEQHVAFTMGLEPHARSSLADDLANGRRMELEALLGEVVRRSDAARLDAPASRALYAVLEPWARRHAAAAEQSAVLAR
jgi:2-dehydropantoate 2-reductase